MSKKQISNYKFVPGAVPPAYGQYPKTVALLEANIDFLIEEMDAYIVQKIAVGASPYNGYTYSESRSTKCKRDIRYVIESIIYDLRYGGNSSSYQTASRYYVNGVIQIITKAVEVDVQTWLRGKITANILTNTPYTALNSTLDQTTIPGASAELTGITQTTALANYIIAAISTGLSTLPRLITPDSQEGRLMPNTVSLLNSNKRFIQEEAIAFIAYNVANNIEPYIYYSYNADKCRRDISYILEGYITDLMHGDNRQTANNASKYWENGIPQVDGDRTPEIAAHTFIKTLIQNYILTNTLYNSRQTIVTQTINNNIVAEVGYETRTSELAGTIIDVITNGLTSLPTVASNRGYIKLPGFFKLKDFLLVTNTTRNEILYNFADPTISGDLTYSETYDSDFPGALYGNEKITTLTFDVDTTNHMVTDSIQIFVENKDGQQVRLNPIATDAMERMKVGIPQSMLDADFEYGLQPTKWQALALQRNYPAIYEVPGSDTPVVNVTTDASANNTPAYTGASLITVTTQSAHGFTVGQPITIRALANSVLGFSRAEGSFIINSVTTLTFTYYAKSKVGAADGDVLASTYTQLRKGAYYTGAGISNPSFNVYSNGSSGNITTSLITAAGRDVIGFTGAIPPVGAPLSGTGIATGTSVTAITGTGGTAASTKLTTSADIGDISITVDSTTGISAGLVFDRGDGVAVTITDVTGNVLSLSGPLTSGILGSTQSYAGLVQSVTSGTGDGAIFTVSRNNSAYSVSITDSGTGYRANNTITILGANLGGSTPTNNATITVNSASGINGVGAFNSGTLVSGSGLRSQTGVSVSGGTGSNLTVTTQVNGSGSIISISIANSGTGYTVGDTITLGYSGGVFVAGSVILTGGVGSQEFGTGYTTANNVSTSVLPSGGTGCTVNITADVSGSVLTVTINNPGTGYSQGDILTILAGDSNARFPADAVSTAGSIQIASINAGGAIQTASIAGTTITAPTKDFISAITISDVTTQQLASGNTGISYTAIATIEATFPSPHGLVPGNTITVQISSTDTNAQLAAGPFFVEQVPTSTTLRYTSRSSGVIINTLAGTLYARPDSFFVHRPFDGGVQLGTASSSHGASAIRMSKKYIRYQSGKGVMYNTGALFAPSYDIRSMTATDTVIGSVITVTTDDTDHGTQVGAQITISGVLTSGYNGVYTVFDVISERVFSIIAYQVLGSSTATLGSPCQMAVRQWHGSTIRAGIFDEQNGMFWQYDGIRMAVGRRSSTFQTAGTININANSNLVAGTNTRFTQQLAAGERVVIRGMTHIVTQVLSDTSLTVAPDYRGVSNVTNVKICKTQDIIIPQESWNLDPCNGSGPSGYNLDVTKMQMIGIQHTWYGAGFIDFMLRGPDGNYIFVHRFRNSNVNTEAYMRTGNQPVRYEVLNEGARGRLTAAMDGTQTTIPLSAEDAYWFPTSGTVLVDNELIRYTGNTGTTLTGCTRSAALSQFTAGSQRNFTGGSAASHTSGKGVILISNTVTPNISHWGSAFMIDGQFDSDRGYIFNYAATGISASVDKATAFLIRLAPSVSNAQVGDLGEKELLNRAQLLLSEIAIASDSVSGGGGIVIEGVLNPQNYPEDPTKITWTGLSSSAAGGQPSFAQIASGGSVTWGGNVYTTTATVQGAFTTTLTAKSFAAITANLTATSFTAVTQTATAPAVTAVQNSTYQFAFSTTRTDFLIPQTTYAAFTTPILANDTLSVATYLTGGQRVVSVTPNFITINSIAYARVVMSAAANANSPTNTAVANVTFTNNIVPTYLSALSTARTDFLIPNTQTSGIAVTDVLSVATYLTSGQSISSITNNYVTIGGTSYARIVMSAAANATSTAGTGNNITVVNTSAATSTYGRALSTARTDFLITDTAYASSGIAVGDTLGFSTSATLSTVAITGSAGQFSCTSTYLAVGMTVTISGTLGGTGTITGYANPTTYKISATNGSTTFTLTTTSDVAITTSAGTPTGLTYTVATFLSGGQSITVITQNYVTISSVAYTRIVMSAAANLSSASGGSNDITVTLTAAGSASSYVKTNYLFFTSTSWISSGAIIGTKVASDQTSFPAGTSVAAISTRVFGGSTVYRATFTQTANTTVAAAATLKFQFGSPYALPGEQVFSFITNPGNTDKLDLTSLKELTATTIGGRGTFPNGPDVLAINIYKVSGTATPVNLILRWGEAQA